MESMTITLGLVVFIWGIALFTIHTRNQKHKEQKKLRMQEYQAQIDSIQLNMPPAEKKETHSLLNTQQEPKESFETQPKQEESTFAKKPFVGNEYEDYLSERFKKLGYSIWEHSKDENMKHLAINIIAKNKKELLLIQCKEWDNKDKEKLSIDSIKAFRTDANDFVELNPLFQNYKLKLLLILSKDMIQESAKAYIEDLKKREKQIDYQVILF